MFLEPIHSVSNPSEVSSSSPVHLPMLRDSISMFLAQHRRGVVDFSDIGDVFLRRVPHLLYSQLEIVWFYSAMRFHTAAKSQAREGSRRLSATKELFQLMVCNSPSISDLKEVAVLAPVVCELCHLARERKDLREEIRVFVEEGFVKYIGMLFMLEPGEESGKERLSLCFADLVRVWTVDRSGEEMSVFFPMVSDRARNEIGVDCEVGYVAGLVMLEAFLLLLCLKFGPGSSKRDMHFWAVQTIANFKSLYFVDALLRMLFEPVLPVTFLLSSEDEVIIREVLYDAVGRVEYPFLIPQNEAQLHSKRLKNLIRSWLFVANKAMLSMRGNIDETELTRFMDAFKSSCLTSCLVKWVLNQAGMERNMDSLVDSFQTPTNIINFIRSGEAQGLTFFDKEDSKNPCYSLSSHSHKNSEEYNFDDTDMAGDSVDNTLPSIPDTRKRKEGSIKAHPEFAKHGLPGDLKRQKKPSRWDEDLSSGSEVDNPGTDEDAADMEH